MNQCFVPLSSLILTRMQRVPHEHLCVQIGQSYHRGF